MTRILVTGGAGYVGSVSAQAFLEAGHDVVVLDDLTTGHRAAVPRGRPAVPRLVRAIEATTAPAARAGADRGDPPLRGALARRRVDRRPGEVLPRQRRRRRRAARGGARRPASSGSSSRRPPPSTASRTRRRSPRTRRSGRSTRTARRSARSRARSRWYGRAYGLRSVSLRYFNVAGATEALGEDHDPETHLIPNVLARGRGRPRPDRLRRRLPDARRHAASATTSTSPTSPTPTCGRIEATTPGDPRTDACLVCNLGNGGGFSIREVIAAAERVVGRADPVHGRAAPGRRSAGPRRRRRRAPREVLGWRPAHPSLDEMVGSAWAWRQRHPDGYPD